MLCKFSGTKCCVPFICDGLLQEQNNNNNQCNSRRHTTTYVQKLRSCIYVYAKEEFFFLFFFMRIFIKKRMKNFFIHIPSSSIWHKISLKPPEIDLTEILLASTKKSLIFFFFLLQNIYIQIQWFLIGLSIYILYI